MSLLWPPDLVALELKEVYWEILKELEFRADCFKLLTKNNISWSSRVIMRGSKCSFKSRPL